MATDADALDVAEKALAQIKIAQDQTLSLMKSTVELGRFALERLDKAIILLANGDAFQALMTLGDLRIRFDGFIKANEGQVKDVG